MKRVTVLGNFSGRNAGDNAILGNLLDDLARAYPGLHFLIPTLKVDYVRRAFGHHNITALGLMPWNLSLKIFGLPTFRSMLHTNIVLITDNILFDRRYFNPMFNYLSTISFMAPRCRRRGIPILLYNASVGPIRTPRGARALQRVLDAGPAVILRDERSRNLLKELNLRHSEVTMGADCALNTEPPPPDRLDRILGRIGLQDSPRKGLGFNVNAYIDTWQKDSGSITRKSFVVLVAKVIDRMIRELDLDVVFFVTQVMDRHIIGEVINAAENRERIVIADNPRYTYQELAGIMSKLEMLVGMRTHSLILSCAVGTPVVNINAYPKSAAFLDTVGLHDWSINFDRLSEENLYEMVRRGWDQREATRAALGPEVAREKAKSVASTRIVGRLLGLSPPASEQSES